MTTFRGSGSPQSGDLVVTNAANVSVADTGGNYTGSTVEAVLAEISDDHIEDATLHFTEGSVDHTAIQNIGTNTHAQLDTAVSASTSHIADATIHYTEGSIDHTAITNIGTNSHAQIDTHIADVTNPHSVTTTQIGAATLAGNSYTATQNVFSQGTTNTVAYAVHSHDASNTTASLTYYGKTRTGTISVNSSVNKADAAAIEVINCDALAIGVNNASPVRFSNSGVDRAGLDSAGNFNVTSGSLGYAAGAGGTVVQITSKNTAVTLNKPSGQITTTGTALAAGGVAGFQLNNSFIAAEDTVLFSLGDGNGFKYNVWTFSITGGNCQVAFKNITAGSLSEAVKINFTIIKGAHS